MLKRRRVCISCAHRFWSFEVDQVLFEQVQPKKLPKHLTGLKRHQVIAVRNKKILRQLASGDKHAVVSDAFGLSESMVTTIARNAGLPSYRSARMSVKVSA